VTAIGKSAVVGIGYLAAFVVAWLAVTVYVAATAGPDRDVYQGMYAFGDSLYFLGAFAFASVPATGLALFFLRPYPRFWRGLALVAAICAVTSVAALAAYVARIDGRWLALTPLWFMGTPVLAGCFLLAGVIAPRGSRLPLCAAAAVHLAVFGCVVALWARHGGG
jgi:hypothetical protein